MSRPGASQPGERMPAGRRADDDGARHGSADGPGKDAAAPRTLALLHTSPVHVPVFDALRDRTEPGLTLRHHVDEELLARARAEGTRAVIPAVEHALARAAADGAYAVLCTCSTIGAVAEAAGEAGRAGGLPVLRVDRPMAAAAVAAGPRIVVLATIASTLEPTRALIEDEAQRSARPVRVRLELVPGAWERFEAGDADGCAKIVAAHADAVRDADAIVLAQASMAPAEHLTTTRVPVLASTRLGFAAAARAVPGPRSAFG